MTGLGKFRLAAYLFIGTIALLSGAIFTLLGGAFVLMINSLAHQCGVPAPDFRVSALYWVVIVLAIVTLRSHSNKD